MSRIFIAAAARQLTHTRAFATRSSPAAKQIADVNLLSLHDTLHRVEDPALRLCGLRLHFPSEKLVPIETKTTKIVEANKVVEAKPEKSPKLPTYTPIHLQMRQPMFTLPQAKVDRPC